MQESAAKNSNQGLSDSNLDISKPVEYEQSVAQAGAAINSARRKKSSAAFRTISEVADDLGVKQHVLRFWETKFSQVKPLKRGGGRRYYRPEDVDLLQAIYRLLYVEGYTIKGVQKLLREVGKKQVVTAFSTADSASAYKRKPLTGDNSKVEVSSSKPSSVHNHNSAGDLTQEQKETLKTVLDELKSLRGMIKPR